PLGGWRVARRGRELLVRAPILRAEWIGLPHAGRCRAGRPAPRRAASVCAFFTHLTGLLPTAWVSRRSAPDPRPGRRAHAERGNGKALVGDVEADEGLCLFVGNVRLKRNLRNRSLRVR